MASRSRQSAKEKAKENKEQERIKQGHELVRGVELINRERGVPTEVVFSAIEKAVRLAIMKLSDDEEGIVVNIDRQKGFITASQGDKVLDPMSGELGRIAAQAAKQLMIQMFREEESNTLLEYYLDRKGELVTGTVQRFEGGAATVTLDKTEAILPRGEQIPGESHHVGEKVKAIILDVKKVGHRVKIILSRTHPDLVRRLFEKEIPEIDERTIDIKAVAREAGYRTKVAVSSIDMKVDCVGACVGVRGSRIKNIVEVLGGVERIDIVRWNDSLQVLIPNALQPAAIEEVFLYPRLERAVVLVKEDQLSLAIGRRGQNVRLASKLVGWDIEIMTHDELNASIEKAEEWFRQMPGITDEMVEALIEEGFLSYEDIDFLKTHELMELTGLSEEDADEVLIFAGEKVEEMAKEPKAPKAREAAPAQQPSGPPTTADKVAKLFPDVAPPAPAPPASAAAQAFESLFSQSPPAGQAEAVPQEEAAPEEAAPPAAEEEWPAEPEESAPPAEGAEVASGAEGVEPAAPTTEGAQPAPAVPAPPEQPHVEGQGEQGEWRG